MRSFIELVTNANLQKYFFFPPGAHFPDNVRWPDTMLDHSAWSTNNSPNPPGKHTIIVFACNLDFTFSLPSNFVYDAAEMGRFSSTLDPTGPSRTKLRVCALTQPLDQLLAPLLQLIGVRHLLPELL